MTRDARGRDFLKGAALRSAQPAPGRPRGVRPRETLETLFRYSHRQGLASRQLKIEELFEPSTLGFAESA